jgi:hypothetical protein
MQMVELTRDEFGKLVEFLVPYLSNDTRRETLTIALWDTPVLEQIDWSGDDRTFTIRIVQQLLKHGEITLGQPAIVALLEGLRPRLGTDKQAYIDQFLSDYIKAVPESTQTTHTQICLQVQISNDGYIAKFGEDSRHIPKEQVRHIQEAIAAKQPVVQIGTRLFELFLPDAATDLLSGGRPISELRIDATDRTLLALPWEILHDGRRYVLQKEDITLTRQRSPKTGISFQVGKLPLRVLVTASGVSQPGKPQLQNLAEQFSNKITLTTMQNMAVADIIDKLKVAETRGTPFHVWHHAGHITAKGEVLELTFEGSSMLSPMLGKLIERHTATLRLFSLAADYDTSVGYNAALKAIAGLELSAVVGNVGPVDQTALDLYYQRFFTVLVENGLKAALASARQELDEVGFDVESWGQFVCFKTVRADMILPAPTVSKTQAHTPSNFRRDKIFISYSHADADWFKKLRTHLVPLERRYGLEAWGDDRIEVGDDWYREINNALHSARVAILLVSPNFIASDFIYQNELPPILDAAKQKGLRIVWIPISTSFYEGTGIETYQAAHNPSRPLDMLKPGEVNQILTKVVRQISKYFES